jgi:hypothetical protein
MSTVSLNNRINKFIEAKHREMPELRDKDVDELFDDLVKDTRSGHSY